MYNVYIYDQHLEYTFLKQTEREYGKKTIDYSLHLEYS